MSDGVRCEACGKPMRARSTWAHECRSCGFLASTLRAGAGTGIEGLEALRRANYERLLDRVAGVRPLFGARMLEVGSAWGWFLEAAARRGARAHGIEPELANVERCRRAGLDVEHGYFPQDLQDAGPYDFVVFNDVFEHIPLPSALAADIERKLAPGGLLVINLPSSDGTLFRLANQLDRIGIRGPYQRLWQKGFPSPHVSYFNSANLALLIERHSAMRLRLVFPLLSITREGLGPRIRASHSGASAWFMRAGIYALSLALPHLPADIVVSVFERPP